MSRTFVVAPILVVTVLALPTFSFPFLWDDFDFLGRTQVLELRELAPDPEILYYRPISRELYFGLVHLLGTHPSIAHLLNLAGVLGIVWLLFACTRDLAGPRAAAVAALLFSGMGAVPLLVGWISSIQDVLAILFTLGALLAELRGRRVWALCFLACALLSKETSLAMIPALLAAAWMRNPHRAARIRALTTYLFVAALWAAIHPATRLLFGAESPGSGSAPTITRSLVRGTLAAFNVPLGSVSFVPPGFLLPVAVAILLSVFALRRIWREAKHPSNPTRPVLRLSLLLAVPSLVLIAVLVPVWAPYYACFPALGVCMAAGTYLAHASRAAATIAVGAYLTLGVWTRTVGLEPEAVTESNLRRSASALVQVEKNFKKLRSSFPPGSAVYISAQLSGPTGMHTLLYRFQPLRVWYREPSLFVLDPNRYHPDARAEFLFWLNRQLDVIEIDLRTFQPRSSGSKPELFQYQKTLRTFALGRAAGRRTDEAVYILLGMPGRPPDIERYDRRVAAAILIEAGRRPQAEALLNRLPPFSREEALEASYALLHEPSPGLALDDAVMEAYGLSPSDPEANRFLMIAFDMDGFAGSAIRFAERVSRIVPGDAEAAEIRRKWLSKKAPPRLTVQIPHS